jgi:hypothetical protein
MAFWKFSGNLVHFSPFYHKNLATLVDARQPGSMSFLNRFSAKIHEKIYIYLNFSYLGIKNDQAHKH